MIPIPFPVEASPDDPVKASEEKEWGMKNGLNNLWEARCVTTSLGPCAIHCGPAPIFWIVH